MIRTVLKRVLLVVFVASVSSASAQPVFVQGSVGAEIKRFDDEAGKSAYDGTARALAFGIGHEVTPHWVASAEVDFGGRSTTASTTSVVIGGQPRDIHNAYITERRSIAALAGYRTTVHRRVQLGYYAGVSFTVLRREIVSDAAAIVLQDAAAVGLQLAETSSRFEDRLTGPIVGIDAAIRVAPHVALVPALRAEKLRVGEELGGHSIRPSIGARIYF